MSSLTPPFYGRGPAFPWRPDPNTGGIAVTEGKRDATSVGLAYLTERWTIREDVSTPANHVAESINHIPLAISGLLVYASYSAGKMVYVLGEDELRVCFPVSPLRISYTRIRYAGKVETSLRFRLFGGSLPGAHWGTFTTSSLGNAQVIATRHKGTFVLLELSDGDRILISPQEPDALLDALRVKTGFAAPTPSEMGEPRIDRRLAYAQVSIVAIAWLALVIHVATIYPGLPEIIPVHFGLNGVPNRYGNKTELLILMTLSALFPSLNTVFTLKYGKYNKGLTLFLSVIFLLAIGLFALVVNQILQAI